MYVEQDERRLVQARDRERLRAGSGLLDGISDDVEQLSQDMPEVGVVVDNEYRCGRVLTTARAYCWRGDVPVLTHRTPTQQPIRASAIAVRRRAIRRSIDVAESKATTASRCQRPDIASAVSPLAGLRKPESGERDPEH